MKESLRDHKELLVWQKSILLVEIIYKRTQNFPKEEMFGLTSQIRRCSISIPSNIAEGHSRNTDGEFRQFLGIAKGSSAELETQIIIANKLSYLNLDDYNEISDLIIEIRKMISGLQRAIK